MDLVPITKIKISKDRWLNTPIQYEDDLFIRDIVDILCTKVYNWINSKSDFYLVMDYDSFKIQFIQFIYDLL